MSETFDAERARRNARLRALYERLMEKREQRRRRYLAHRAADLERVRLYGQAHPLYYLWRAMRRRCADPRHPSFARYGAKGIAVCDRWQHFPAFEADLSPRPSPTAQLHRLDPDGPYSPDNCLWVERHEHERATAETRQDFALTALLNMPAERFFPKRPTT